MDDTDNLDPVNKWSIDYEIPIYWEGPNFFPVTGISGTGKGKFGVSMTFFDNPGNKKPGVYRAIRCDVGHDLSKIEFGFRAEKDASHTQASWAIYNVRRRANTSSPSMLGRGSFKPSCTKDLISDVLQPGASGSGSKASHNAASSAVLMWRTRAGFLNSRAIRMRYGLKLVVTRRVGTIT
jgi:hypothetical protein